jgi:malonyl-CoA O-methyltransferase
MAADDRNDDDRPGSRRLDQRAVGTALRRMVRRDEPPWLHAEVARRLGEHLGPIRSQPRRILHWWPSIGGGDSVLRSLYPRAEVVGVEPDAAAAEVRAGRRARPWWSLARATSAPLSTDASDAELGRGQLVWANMVLQFVADPPALFERWNRLLEVEGLVVFSCLGPASLRELRELYAAAGWPAPAPEFVDMHDLGDMLVHAGFADPVLDQETLTLRWRNAEAATPRRSARRARRCRRQHRPQLRGGLRTRLQGGAEAAARRSGRRSPR